MADGLEKNAEKLRDEAHKVSVGMREHWARWLRKPWDTHALVNLFVESRRLSPYLMGHIDAILYPILLLTIIATLIF